MPVGIVLEQILARVRESDLREFKDKILPQEEAKEAQLKKDGLRNMSMLVEENKARASGTYLDYSDMGQGTNVDGDVLMVPGTMAPTDKPAEVKSGNAMFDDFLEKLK